MFILETLNLLLNSRPDEMASSLADVFIKVPMDGKNRQHNVLIFKILLVGKHTQDNDPITCVCVCDTMILYYI